MKLWKTGGKGYPTIASLGLLLFLFSVILFFTTEETYLLFISLVGAFAGGLFFYIAINGILRNIRVEASVNAYLEKNGFSKKILDVTPVSVKGTSPNFRGVLIGEDHYLFRRPNNSYAVEMVPFASEIMFYVFHYLKEDRGHDFIVVYDSNLDLHDGAITAFCQEAR